MVDGVGMSRHLVGLGGVDGKERGRDGSAGGGDLVKWKWKGKNVIDSGGCA
jgi:hypothetical protein